MSRFISIAFRATQAGIVLGIGLVGMVLWAADAPAPSKQGIEFFETKIRPVLVQHCFECHSSQSAKVKGGLLLDTKEGMLKGGDKGPSVVPGKPAESLLIQALRHEGMKMPAQKLPANVIADFEKWVQMGAPDPRTGSTSALYKRMTPEEAKTFWAYQAVKNPTVPKVQNAAWPRNAIDHFVLAQLEAKKLAPTADAELRTLVRRIYFDLIGLPPTPAQVEAFLNDAAKNRQKAIEKLTDELLGSKHYGERWGRHWLDLARYAESNGNADNTAFPNAYRYRDYVIASFNADKPYDQFLREQVAGDLLSPRDNAQKDEFLIATGFLALTSKPRAQNNPDYAMDLIADQIDVTTRTVLGLSVLCARCHDHKFDAISQKEYYALAGFFESSSMLAGGGGKGGGAKNGGAGGLHNLSNGGQAMGVREAGKGVDTALCVRGDSTKRGDKVPRGFLDVVKVAETPKIDTAKSGRLQLADYLSKADNPLTARVAVNRIWLHLFGQGLSRTPDNFGALGEKPTHPELLDYLATQFVQKNGSTKAIIKMIVSSRTYQQASTFDAARYKADPDNLNLWRANIRRLEGEPIRDAVLAVSGRLETKPAEGSLAGPVSKGAGKNGAAKEAPVRSVYLGMNRGAPLPELLALFDVANPNLVVAQREITTVPAQSLFLMNSPWVIDQAGSFARRVLGEKDLDDGKRVDLAYRLALARPASSAEREQALNYLHEALKAGNAEKAWTGLCQALYASAEFRYIE